MLRNRLPDEVSSYPDPKLGINLRKSPEDLLPEEAYLLKNCFYDAGVRKRFGSQRFSTPSLGTYAGVGGIKFYYGQSSQARLIAFDTNIGQVSDAGVFTTLTSTMTSGQPTFFTPWSIQERCYISNGADSLRYFDGSSVSTLTGTNIPASPTMVKAFADRLFAIQNGVVVVSDPRVDNVFSDPTSSWSAYQPSVSGGDVVAISVHSQTGSLGDPGQSLLLYQQSALTALAGTDFGSNVTAASPPTGWDATLTVLDTAIGTASPKSICTVPGLGTFWFTQGRNIAWLPLGESQPRLIGDVLFTYRNDVDAINTIDGARLADVWMVYHDRKLKLGLPIGGNPYVTTQYWLDLRPLYENLGAILHGNAEEGMAVPWSGPHTAQPISAVWTETEQGDTDRLMGLEGKSANGCYVYELNPTQVFTEDISTTSSNEYLYDEQTFFNTAGAPGWQKQLSKLLLDCRGYIQFASVTVSDLHATLTSPLTILQLNGASFTGEYYGNGLNYGTGVFYGARNANNLGQVDFTERSLVQPIGDALSVRIQAPIREFTSQRVVSHMKINKATHVE